MAKYSFDFKKKVVLEYLSGVGSQDYLIEKYDICGKAQLQRWIASYQKFGDKGLMRSRQNNFYSFEKKLHVVELYLSSEVSYQELALQEGISNPTLINQWVNRFRIAGPDALRPYKKGRKNTLNNPKTDKTNPLIEETTVDVSIEHVKELEDELLKLRIENAFFVYCIIKIPKVAKQKWRKLHLHFGESCNFTKTDFSSQLW